MNLLKNIKTKTNEINIGTCAQQRNQKKMLGGVFILKVSQPNTCKYPSLKKNPKQRHI